MHPLVGAMQGTRHCEAGCGWCRRHLKRAVLSAEASPGILPDTGENSERNNDESALWSVVLSCPGEELFTVPNCDQRLRHLLRTECPTGRVAAGFLRMVRSMPPSRQKIALMDFLVWDVCYKHGLEKGKTLSCWREVVTEAASLLAGAEGHVGGVSAEEDSLAESLCIALAHTQGDQPLLSHLKSLPWPPGGSMARLLTGGSVEGRVQHWHRSRHSADHAKAR